jgi:hypothetical protein
MRDTLTTLRSLNSALMPAAGRARVEIANKELEGSGFGQIPPDYHHFLLACNGAQSPAFVLLGTDPQPMTGGAQADGIHQATERFLEDRGEEGKVVLGWTSGGVTLVYDGAAEQYQLMDDSSNDLLYRFTTVEEFVKKMLKLKGIT